MRMRVSVDDPVVRRSLLALVLSVAAALLWIAIVRSGLL